MRGSEMYWEAVIGRVLEVEGGEPVKGVKVWAYDKDLVIDDPLGESITDGEGKFRIEFTADAYSTPFSPGEGRPDIYLRLLHPGGKTHQTKVQWDISGDMVPTNDPAKAGADGEIEVMDLGDVAFPSGG